MNYRGNKTGVSFWEYGWYLLVTVLLLMAGIVLAAATVLVYSVRIVMKLGFKGMVLTVVGILCLIAVYSFWSFNRTADIGNQTVSIIIAQGDNFSGIANNLAEEEVVPSRFWLTLLARITGVDTKLTPGRYDFSGCNSCRSVLDRFRRADFLRIKITVPEGLPLWKLASLLSNRLELDSSAFVSLNHDSIFLAKTGLPYLEGFLFPETYLFAWGLSEREVALIMVNQYRAQTDSIWPDSILNGLSQVDIIKLASIIEAETHLDSERVLVSSVYMNRLRQDMKLDADPTVIYGLGGLNRPLYRRDIQKDTPYNTYLYKGLPPTPINSPGLDAIKAALNPAETDYLFFVANETGGHVFSRTNAEHNRARRRIRSN
ncbi:MAG: endolytic transglycosylase MltG [Candidatus Zixiibacteriota bacterium]|nr:MAG: endolytic transglycosylase MltG [candidate division Zixibacteria bacterium]